MNNAPPHIDGCIQLGKTIKASSQQFKKFNELLDKPAQRNEKLHELLTKPSVIDKANK